MARTKSRFFSDWVTRKLNTLAVASADLVQEFGALRHNALARTNTGH